jgi:hypothetical protein
MTASPQVANNDNGSGAPAARSRRASAEATFRVTVEQRLLKLEADMNEIKTRINGLLFFIAGTVVAQVLLRLVA